MILPMQIKNDKETYNELCKIISSIEECKILDFSQVNFIEGNLCSVLGSLLDSYKEKIKVIGIKEEIRKYFGKNNFCKKLELEPYEDEYSTTIEYKEFTKRCDDEIGEYIENVVLSNKGFSIPDEVIKDQLSGCIFELFENAYFHGETTSIYTCGQFFPKKKELIFSIVDLGKTIPDNVKKKENNLKDCECIEWAMGYKNSTKSLKNSYPGGSGLYLLEKFIKDRNGWIQIISKKGIYEKKFKDDINIYKGSLKHNFPGTVITFCIEYNNEGNSYIRATEEDDEFSIIQQIFRRDIYE